jgi:hypothetical protein
MNLPVNSDLLTQTSGKDFNSELWSLKMILHIRNRFSYCVAARRLLRTDLLCAVALDLPEAGWTETDGPKEDLADHVVELFTKHRDMMDDYFSLQIDTVGKIPDSVRGNKKGRRSRLGIDLSVTKSCNHVENFSETT